MWYHSHKNHDRERLGETMMRWPADPTLNELIRRYYAGEAQTWPTIRAHIEEDMRKRGILIGAYHIRLRRQDAHYEIIIEDAQAYANDS
jgi:hypothetical protein